ncbi:hypothetical protein PTE30175_00925 [Pandoraea terrae]|uniref:T6SS Phospholipase effector Tle1-like catalytic domain-containing protein n=1 Tax=Pandoraea terrae TaxID=1537710 RepID=A0A5E4ST61_9BURK|nr:DUF2235 domain-containing protein [Pandoraea terrae]VVD78271.1 hypothetical protein PTE30175_00925 [Pandoraea terrae]
MNNATPLDTVDRTPLKVLSGMITTHKPYKHDECIPCGAVIKMGFFFDAFGRHRDFDDPSTSRYSNICRLWEAHRDNKDDRRKDLPNQFWYPFYYSGLGTELNKDAENNEIVSAAVKTAKALGTSAVGAAQSTGLKVVGADKLLDLKKAPGEAVKRAASEALDEMSWRPVSRVYGDLVAQAKTVPGKVGRVLTFARDHRWGRRLEAAGRGTLYDVKKNPLKAGWSVAKGVFVGVAMEAVPQVRDNAAIAALFGTGVEDRLYAALKQFEAAYRDAKSQMDKIQRIEVSVFGADRGGVLARAFVNELVRKYKRRDDLDLAIEDNAIEIKFVGLLDAVSSLIAANKLLDFVPFVNMIKQNYGDQPLGVPEAVRRCVHFAAAHELRFYQRLDSLEKTRGDQYLYPGSSEDITGGAREESTGFHAELQRVTLRDMLNEALMAGAAVDMMEDLFKFKGNTFDKFTLAQPITVGQASYKIPDLIGAYRAFVPREKGLNFHAHMQVFLRWQATRYQTPAFRASLNDATEDVKRAHRALVQQRTNAVEEYRAARARRPIDRQALGQALARMQAAQDAERASLRSTASALSNSVVGVWERIGREAEVLIQRQSMHDARKESAHRIRALDRNVELPYDADMEHSAQLIESVMLAPETLALVRAWQDGASGRNPLPPEVMALFDLLVHDTMLTSWHDHVLSSNLYFRTRETDTLGTSDFDEEAKQRAQDQRSAQRVDEFSKRMAKPGALGGF